MLHIKFHGNQPCGSEEGLGHVTWTKYINFLPPFALRLHMKFNSNWRSRSEKKSFENVDDRRMDGQMLDATDDHPIWGAKN